MSTPDRGVFLLPTRRRLDKLARFLESAAATGCKTPIVLIVWAEEYRELQKEYNELIIRYNLTLLLTPFDGGAAYKCQYAYEQNRLNKPDQFDWFGFVSDDYVCETPNWDQRLAAQITGWNVVSCDDKWQAPKRIIGAILWSRALIEAVGFLALPNSQHWYWDDVWEVLGRATQCWQCDMSVVVRHANAALSARPVDETTERLALLVKNDALAFDVWKSTQRDAAIRRIENLMSERGVKMQKIDLSAYRLMIASPCMRGWYHRSYTKSLVQTFMALKQWGAHVDWFDLPNASDLVLARSALFSAFQRSSFTHYLSIDDDMGWSAVDIARMLMLNRDFIAAAGPAKSFDRRFACSNMDTFGRPLPINVEPETGVAHLTHVGGAFVMISKNCADRMAASYQDLMFLDANSQECYGVYHPFTLNKRHIGEDYAFCERWRHIGGEIHVLSSVNLQHSGDWTFEGRYDEFVVDQMAKLERESKES